MVVVVVGGILEIDGKFLLVQENKGRWKGTWNIPAGRLEDNESFIEGAEREFFEETGYKVKATGIVDILNRVYDDVNIINILLDMDLIENNGHYDSLEIADIQFYSIDEIIKMKNQLRADGFYLNSLQKKLKKEILPLNIIQNSRYHKNLLSS